MWRGTTMTASDLVIPSDSEIRGIADVRRRAAVQKQFQEEVNKLYRTIAGLTWGSGNQMVRGSQLSEGTRYALAEFCRVTRANPLIHIDILGGKPFHNAKYYSDLLNNNDFFISYTQKDLSPSVEEAYRAQATRYRETAMQLSEGAARDERLLEALDLEDEADNIALARAQWSPRENATCVIETTIRRFYNAAPIELIRAGKITDVEPYVTTIQECHWAGGMEKSMAEARKYDPIGDAFPSLTARTRSLRRCATKAFSAWLQPYEDQLEKARTVIEADFEIIDQEQADRRDEVRNATVVDGEAQAATEATAGRLAVARELPLAGQEEVEPSPPTEVPPARPAKNATDPVTTEAFDRNNARKRLFATLRDAGVPEDGRKEWAKAQELPASTSLWTEEDFSRAQEVLMGGIVEEVTAAAEIMGVTVADVSLELLGKETPEYLKDWQTIEGHLQGMVSGPRSPDSDPDQEQLL
jgi:hypothetical protein